MIFNRWTKGTKDRFYVDGLGGAADAARFYVEQTPNSDEACVKWDFAAMSIASGRIYANDIYAEIERRIGSTKWSELVAAYENAMEASNV